MSFVNHCNSQGQNVLILCEKLDRDQIAYDAKIANITAEIEVLKDHDNKTLDLLKQNNDAIASTITSMNRTIDCFTKENAALKTAGVATMDAFKIMQEQNNILESQLISINSMTNILKSENESLRQKLLNVDCTINDFVASTAEKFAILQAQCDELVRENASLKAPQKRSFIGGLFN